ncbi:HNH endonuclease [Conexibacter sp. SYSU D00693]|uniref:HNH endonuclease n=1 Tax=Conexibacter sp. SYSU D00693 TaxID=2812560 RepID=UPI00196B1E8E|nr:HNH endonuclease signature motif containing protein [Conexibacter sp. SYSU D00693]
MSHSVATDRPPRAPGRAERLAAAVEADGGRCVWCAAPFEGLRRATTEHLVPRVKGGPSWAENELAACRRCNKARGHVAPVDWLAECRRRGWEPDEALVVARLRALETAFAVRGGARKARPYVERQLRRLAPAA